MNTTQMIGYATGKQSKKECARFKREYAHNLNGVPKKNYVICTGSNVPKSDMKYEKCLVVLDLDVEGKEIDLFEAFYLMGDYTDTYLVRTGSGGYHFYYWVTNDVVKSTQKTSLNLTDAAKELGLKGVDVRGEGGIVFGAGCKFNEHSHGYSVEQDLPIKELVANEWVELFSLFTPDKVKFEWGEREDVLVPTDVVIQTPSPEILDDVAYISADKYVGGQNYAKEKPIRAGFEAILNGDFEILHGEQDGVQEFEFWKAFWREIIACGHDFKRVSFELNISQKEYDEEETIRQLKCIPADLLAKRPSVAVYDKLFPSDDELEEYTEDAYNFADNMMAEYHTWAQKQISRWVLEPKAKKTPVSVKHAEVMEKILPVLYNQGFVYVIKNQNNDATKGKWMYYHEGYLDDNAVHVTRIKRLIKELYHVAGFRIGTRQILEVMSLFKIDKKRDNEYSINENLLNGHPELINYKNCLYYTRSGEIKPHRRNIYSSIRVDYDYNPDGKCPKFEIFMKQIVSEYEGQEREDIRAALWELIGYCLTSDITIGRGFVIYGGADSGKSVFGNVIGALVGQRNRSKIAMQTLAEGGKKALAAIVGKILNSYPDLNDRAIKEVGMINDMITEPYLNYEAKFFPDAMCRNTVKHLYMCNLLPIVMDILTAWGKRWCLWKLNHIIYAKETYMELVRLEKRPFGTEWVEGKGIWNEYAGVYEQKIKGWEFENIIADKDEMEGIIAHAMRSLKDLYARGDFAGFPPQKVIQEWMSATTPVFTFVDECCFVSNDKVDFVNKAYLYTAFREWVEDNGLLKGVPKTIRSFTKILDDLGYPVLQVREGQKRFRVYNGFGVTRTGHVGEIINWCEKYPHKAAINPKEGYIEGIEALMDGSPTMLDGFTG